MPPHQQMGMSMQRVPLSTQTTPLLPTPSPMQTTAVPPMMPPQHAGPIQPLMSAQPPTHIPPPGFPRAMPPPRFQGPPSIPPPGARPMVPPGPRPLPPMGYSGYSFRLKVSVDSLVDCFFLHYRAPPFPPNGMPGMPPPYGNQASSAASALASHPILQQGYD